VIPSFKGGTRMARGFRIFFVHDDGALRRIPMTRFERLYLRNDKNERFPEYARQRVRYALVVLELKNKKPVAVERIDCSVITFYAEGELDQSEWLRGAALGMNMAFPEESTTSSSSVIDASSHFSRKSYENQFRWRLTREIQSAIEEAAIGGKTPSLRLV
jgi:hypothetical protein